MGSGQRYFVGVVFCPGCFDGFKGMEKNGASAVSGRQKCRFVLVCSIVFYLDLNARTNRVECGRKAGQLDFRGRGMGWNDRYG